ncbi:MAG TPA: peptidyl-prolyl cis-trans isomerase [Polyangia bacterium]|nr:peptidyl-prolyl cis-trans isomerase [Polyangia bacterium]
MATTTLRSAPTLLSALALLAVPACKHGGGSAGSSQNVDPSQVVAKVDDAVISVADVQERINKQSPFVRARYTSSDKKKEFVDGLVRFEVLAAEAARRGYDKDPDVQRVMKQQMISKLMQKDFESKLKVEDVPDADVEKYYNEHPAEFHQKDEVRVSEILVKDKAKADRVASEARAAGKGAAPSPDPQKPFRDLVAKYSEDEDSKPRGGDLSFFAADTTAYPKPIVDGAFALKEIGDVSAPIKTDKGWAVLKLTQRRPGFNRPLAEVKRQIQQRLFRDMRSKAMDNFVDDLKKKSSIAINEDNLAKVVVDTATTGPSLGMPTSPNAVQLGAPPAGTPAPRHLPMQPAGAPAAQTHP